MKASMSVRVSMVVGVCSLFAWAGALSAAEVIVDNTDSGFSVVSGSWTTATSASDKYGTNYRYTSTTTSGSSSVQWQPSLPTAGTYEVFVWYPTGSRLCSDARYTVYYNGGSQTVTVNQTTNNGSWVSIGTFSFAAGTAGRVTLSNYSSQSNRRAHADAVRFNNPEPATLTMAVSPTGAGTTTPSVGAHAQYVGDVVNISAAAVAGYRFDHWTVSAGAAVASPTSASTTVTMDASKTVTAVFVQTTTLTMAVSPAGSGTTSPAVGDSQQDLGGTVNLAATAGVGYMFDHWAVSTGAAVANPTAASTTMTMDVAKTVTAVFIAAPPVDLTMAVSPAGAGATSPTVGGPYSKQRNEVVGISASPNAGYVFDHWTVSAGVVPANPTSASTTVTMDAAKTVTAVFIQGQAQFRAVWADAFHEGFKSKTEIDNLISRCLAGRYNAIVAEVCAYHDTTGGGHGAYWNSSIVPKATDITTSGLPNGDPLTYLVQAAHDNGIEVHCWMVAFRVSAAWPPSGNTYLAAHPEFLTVPRASTGAGAVTVGGVYTFDPGSPDVQDYLMSVVRELVSNYAIDGVNWDYIRYTTTDAGYPASSTYENSGLKRFQRIYNRSDTPNATGDTQWSDFRRRTITEVVRRTRAEAAAITSNPRQPVRVTCDLITTGNVSSTDFTASTPYNSYLSNWGYWLAQGYIDGGMPMCYDREYDSSQASWFRNWVNACVNWRGQRHMYIGQANYLNTMAGSITQMQYAYNAGANGTVNYSYVSTVDSNMDGTTETDWSWYTYAGTNLFTQTAVVPNMPWRSPATATEGTLWGRVTLGGVGVDDATVVVGSTSVQTDAAGYYVATMLPAPTGSSAAFTVVATKDADSGTRENVQVFAGDIRRQDIALDGCSQLPVIGDQPVSVTACMGSTATFHVTASGCAGTMSYQWQKNEVNISDGGHYSGATTDTLTVSNVDAADGASYRCVATDYAGSSNSNAAILTLKQATSISQQPASYLNSCPGSTVVFSVTASGDGTVTYVWKKDGAPVSDGGHYSGAATASLTVSNVDASDTGSYSCVISAGCGSATSSTASLTLKPAVIADFDHNCTVDLRDFDLFQACATGPAGAYNPLPAGCTMVPDGQGFISADLDRDSDVDQDDFGTFQRCYSDNGTIEAGCLN